MATDLDGVAQCRFGVRCGRMDLRRRTTLLGVVVASMAERAGTRYMQQYSSKDGLVAGGCGDLIPGRRPG